MTEQPSETTELAGIKDLQELAERIPDNWALCKLFAGTRRASEAEMMVAQTLHACVINHKKHGDMFSFRGDGVFSSGGGGLVDNETAYGMLLERGYFVEEERGGKTIIRMTRKLVDLLRGHLARR